MVGEPVRDLPSAVGSGPQPRGAGRACGGGTGPGRGKGGTGGHLPVSLVVSDDGSCRGDLWFESWAANPAVGGRWNRRWGPWNGGTGPREAGRRGPGAGQLAIAPGGEHPRDSGRPPPGTRQLAVSRDQVASHRSKEGRRRRGFEPPSVVGSSCAVWGAAGRDIHLCGGNGGGDRTWSGGCTSVTIYIHTTPRYHDYRHHHYYHHPGRRYISDVDPPASRARATVPQVR